MKKKHFNYLCIVGFFYTNVESLLQDISAIHSKLNLCWHFFSTLFNTYRLVLNKKSLETGSFCFGTRPSSISELKIVFPSLLI